MMWAPLMIAARGCFEGDAVTTLPFLDKGCHHAGFISGTKGESDPFYLLLCRPLAQNDE